MKAICRIRPEPHYRREAFENGLKRAGYELAQGGRPADKRDILVVWNRHGPVDREADEWEQRGGTVIVCENGYLGKDSQGRQLYAMSVHGHNGSGWFPIGDADRFAQLEIELQPWREGRDDGYLLLCAQRGIGSRTMASPAQWEIKTGKALTAIGQTKLTVRRHPGQVPAKTTLEQDLEGARACVIWSSASGVKALVMGIPVIYTAPHWICADAAVRGVHAVASLMRNDEMRRRAMHKMAWGQRTVEEIESGEPFVIFRECLGEARW